MEEKISDGAHSYTEIIMFILTLVSVCKFTETGSGRKVPPSRAFKV
jgi:hypothetical protein